MLDDVAPKAWRARGLNRPDKRPSAEGYAKTIQEAIAIAKFGDSTDTVDDGAALFAAWSIDHLGWGDIARPCATNFAKVLKDPDAERGKQCCWSGSIVEIKAERTSLGTVFLGGLMLPDTNIVRSVVVRDTGDIVQNSPVRLCGVVAGLADYANSGGGTTHAIQVVGMFDLPENQKLPPARRGSTAEEPAPVQAQQPRGVVPPKTAAPGGIHDTAF